MKETSHRGSSWQLLTLFNEKEHNGRLYNNGSMAYSFYFIFSTTFILFSLESVPETSFLLALLYL